MRLQASNILSLGGITPEEAAKMPSNLTWGITYPIAFLLGGVGAVVTYYSASQGKAITAAGVGIFGFVLPIALVTRAFREGYNAATEAKYTT